MAHKILNSTIPREGRKLTSKEQKALRATGNSASDQTYVMQRDGSPQLGQIYQYSKRTEVKTSTTIQVETK